MLHYLDNKKNLILIRICICITVGYKDYKLNTRSIEYSLLIIVVHSS